MGVFIILARLFFDIFLVAFFALFRLALGFGVLGVFVLGPYRFRQQVGFQKVNSRPTTAEQQEDSGNNDDYFFHGTASLTFPAHSATDMPPPTTRK
jgi:hypothetical protein